MTSSRVLKNLREAVDEIAAVEGIDLLFVGPGDLGIRLGVPLDFAHPSIEQFSKVYIQK